MPADRLAQASQGARLDERNTKATGWSTAAVTFDGEAMFCGNDGKFLTSERYTAKRLLHGVGALVLMNQEFRRIAGLGYEKRGDGMAEKSHA
jgi:hypothetical protein